MSKLPDIVSQAAVVILAAGNSSRLGRPKQLLQYKGKSLIQHAAAAALHTSLRPVVVVTGAHEALTQQEVAGMDVHLAHNAHWNEGMASSLRTGLTAAQQVSDIDAVIFMVCDQPYLSSQLLETILKTQQASGMPIVACRYGQQTGVPVLWHKKYFNELLALQGDAGAKKLLRQYAGKVATVEFPLGVIDIDTETDYQGLTQ